MEQMDKSLLAYVQDLKSPVLQIRCLRSALDRVAKLLKHLQRDLEFMHGDLHGENVMLKERPYNVYLIDFGMSSTRAERGRHITGSIQRGPVPSASGFLDTHDCPPEDLSLSGHEDASRWCDAFVRPYWDAVRKGIMSGKTRESSTGPNTRFRLPWKSCKRAGRYSMHITSFTKTLGTLITPPAARMAFDADFDLVALERPERRGVENQNL